MFNQIILNRHSDAVYSLSVNALLGCVFVEYKSGGYYLYKNVSRRAIVNLMMNPNMSLGFWVNSNCKVARTKCFGYANAGSAPTYC